MLQQEIIEICENSRPTYRKYCNINFYRHLMLTYKCTEKIQKILSPVCVKSTDLAN
jgi:hypothetical protein